MYRWLTTILMVIAATCAIARAGGAVCGNGVWEGVEECDDGPSNGADGCCDANCQIVDGCDAFGECSEGDVTFAEPTRPAALLLSGLGPDGGPAVMRFRGVLSVQGAPLMPDRDGVRITLGGEYIYSLVFGVLVPGGPPWTALPAGGWSYSDPAGRVGGVTRITLTPIPSDARQFAIELEVHPGPMVSHLTGMPLAASDITFDGPMTLHLVFHPGTPASSCTALHFNVFYGVGICRFLGGGRRMQCMAPKPPRPCRWQDANGATRCTAVDAARAEERYFAHHGEYSSSCDGLPGFTQPPPVVCVAAGTEYNYVVVTSSPTGTIACTWQSPPGDTPNPDCR